MNANKANRLAGLFTATALAVLSLGIGFYAVSLRDDGMEKPAKTLEDYLNDGKKFYERGDYSEAIVSYQKVVSMDEGNQDALMGLGSAYVTNADYESAVKTYQSVLDADPSNVDACVELATTLLLDGRRDEAKELVDTTARTVSDERLTGLQKQMTVEAPVFSVASGTYDSYQLLTIENSGQGAVVYYTTDGSEPDEYSAVMGDGMVLSEPHVVLRAKAYNALGFSSEETAAEYTITVPAQAYQGDYDTMDYLCRILGKNDGNVWNYELASLRDIYLVGPSTMSQQEMANVTFTENGWKSGNNERSSTGNLRDLSFLAWCPFVKSVNIAWQNQLSLEGVQTCRNLESLAVVNCGVTDLSPLAGLGGLRRLSLGGNDISDVSVLSGLSNLEFLGLWNNRITDVSPLGNLTKLTQLNLSGNQLSTADALSGLTGLKELWIRSNRLSDLSFTDSMPDLKVLMAGGNPVTNYGKLELRAADFNSTDLTE